MQNWLTGIDLGGTKTEVILLDNQSNEHYRKRVPTPAGDYQATLHTIHALVQQAEGRPGVVHERHRPRRQQPLRGRRFHP